MIDRRISLMCIISAVSYNQPNFTPNAVWYPDAKTVFNQSSGLIQPRHIFVNRNNTVYVADDSGNGHINAWAEGNPVAVRSISNAYNAFVTANGDIYFNPHSVGDIQIQPIIETSSHPVMRLTPYCEDIFVDVSNTLYCSISYMNQIIAKSLDDSPNTLRLVAGTGCYGSTLDMLNSPSGIFVDLSLSIFVADMYNHRIQRFSAGQSQGITVAGSGVSGTINLLTPRDVMLDGNGYLFIADTGQHRIIGSGPDGFRCVAGCINGNGSSSNQLSNPMSMSFDSYGNIWIADYNNARIQKFILNPNISGRYRTFIHRRQVLGLIREAMPQKRSTFAPAQISILSCCRFTVSHLISYSPLLK